MLHQNSLKLSFNSARGSAGEGHTSPERLAGDGSLQLLPPLTKKENLPHMPMEHQTLAVNLV